MTDFFQCKLLDGGTHKLGCQVAVNNKATEAVVHLTTEPEVGQEIEFASYGEGTAIASYVSSARFTASLEEWKKCKEKEKVHPDNICESEHKYSRYKKNDAMRLGKEEINKILLQQQKDSETLKLMLTKILTNPSGYKVTVSEPFDESPVQQHNSFTYSFLDPQGKCVLIVDVSREYVSANFTNPQENFGEDYVYFTLKTSKELEPVIEKIKSLINSGSLKKIEQPKNDEFAPQ